MQLERSLQFCSGVHDEDALADFMCKEQATFSSHDDL